MKTFLKNPVNPLIMLIMVLTISCSTEGDGNGCTHRTRGVNQVAGKNNFPENRLENGIDYLSSGPISTTVKVVWGKVVGGGRDIITIPHDGVEGKRGKLAVASKLIPVAFAEGAWIGDSSSVNATFEVDMDISPGQTIRIQDSSLRDQSVSSSYLLAYRDPEGTQMVNLNEEQTIPDNGVLVLYFTGNFEAEGTATYNINSRSTGDPFVLKVYQPKFHFVREDGETIIPDNERVGSDPNKQGSWQDKWVFVGTVLSRKIAAFDPVDGGICYTCTFSKDEVSTVPFIRTGGQDRRATNMIIFLDKGLINGIGNLSFISTDRIQHENDSIGFFTVGGPSQDPNTLARWDYLQFREPPAPYPVSAEIFDRNGDGKGDSIRIVYNRALPADSLPNKIQVVWSLRDTVSFGLAMYNNGKYTNEGFSTSDNVNYWNHYLKRDRNGTCKECADTIVITLDYGELQFSHEVKTASHGVGESVISWSTFVSDEGFSGITSGFSTAIADKIPPIIISAEFEGSDKCGSDPTKTCRDQVFIELSEPVVMAEGAFQLEKAREAFAYKLINAKGDGARFEVYKESKSLPVSIRWSNIRDNFPERDSSVVLTYASYRTSFDNSYTPALGDSVRLLDKFGSRPEDHAFRDLAGNAPNINEWGRRIMEPKRYIPPNECLVD